MSQAGDHPLPDTVLEQAKWHVLDTVAAMISGSNLPPGRFAIQFARSYGGDKVATVAGSNILCGPIEAALVMEFPVKLVSVKRNVSTCAFPSTRPKVRGTGVGAAALTTPGVPTCAP